MTGGTVYIKIESPNGEKVNVTSTSAQVKEGTYKKVERAIALQKQIVFIDFIYGGNEAGAGTVIAFPSVVTGGKKGVRISALGINNLGTAGSTASAAIFDDDTIVSIT